MKGKGEEKVREGGVTWKGEHGIKYKEAKKARGKVMKKN